MSVRYSSKAACRGQTHLFFAPDGEIQPEKVQREDKAKEVCRTCQVRRPCLEEGLAGEESGIWGGTTETERNKMMGKRRRVS